jgi:predicted metal-dependent hydrolase
MCKAVPEEFWQGVEQFNQGQFYACHDTLEALWLPSTEPQKTFYQGILQIAVALYHLGNYNWRGAVILLGEGINKLQRYPPTYAEIDVDGLLTSSAALLTALQQAGADKIGDWIVGNGAISMPGGDQALRLPCIIRERE